MLNVLDSKNYIVEYTGDNRQEYDKFLSVIGRSEREYYGRKWIVSGSILKEISETIPPYAFSYEEDIAGHLLKLSPYGYQKKAIRFGLEKKSGIIVAPCGAGKTPILLSLFIDSRNCGLISPKAQALIVVKSSLKVQWGKEVAKFSDLKMNIINTSKAVTSASLKKKLDALNKEKTNLLASRFMDYAKLDKVKAEINDLEKQIEDNFLSQFSDEYDILIANYETLRDKPVLEALKNNKNLEFIGADEIHYIKNDTAARSKALCELSGVKMRFGSTATPLQKNVMDAFSISKFVSPKTFPKKGEFAERYAKMDYYGNVVGSKNEKELNEKLSDYMLVISKEEVSKQLPAVTVVTRYCNLTNKQEAMTETLMREIQELKEEERAIYAKFGGNPPRNNPDLMKCEANILARQTFASELADSEDLLLASDSNLAKKYCTKSKSEKIEMLLDLLEEIIESGEKATIFSKYRKLQDILAEHISQRFPDVKIAFVNGEMTSERRYNEVYDKFRDDKNYKILIMSDAGAEGMNLSRCKYLIEMEPADSYLIQTQRRGRIERADSVHDTVYCYQLIALNSYDEIALKIVNKKTELDQQIVKGKFN